MRIQGYVSTVEGRSGKYKLIAILVLALLFASYIPVGASHSAMTLSVVKVYHNENFVRMVPSNKSIFFVVALKPSIYMNNVSSIFPPLNAVKSLEQYFEKYGLYVYTYKDHLNLFVYGNAEEINAALHTQIKYYMAYGKEYYMPSSPLEIPSIYSPLISSIDGLNSYTNRLMLPMEVNGNIDTRTHAFFQISSNNVQYFYGSDFQYAFGSINLFDKGIYPYGIGIVNLMWEGQDSNGNLVGPFYPSDVYNYLNDSFPSSEPKPTLKAIGVSTPGGASPVPPGPSALLDVTPARTENTLDMDMLMSNSPGATIYDVYVSSPSLTDITAAFGYVLNNLNNVYVITNSWGTMDNYNSAWNNYLIEAKYMGITVLAASGDSGGKSVMFPSTDASNNYGTIAVGGDTITVSGTPSSPGPISNATVWYGVSSNGSSIGTTSGISTVYYEPVWQNRSIANRLINGLGRGVADVSSVANNTIIYLMNTSTGKQKSELVQGTSIASPVVASQIAEIDAYLHKKVGFFLPQLYAIGDNASRQPYAPIFPVLYGHTSTYAATRGWSFPAGFGIINTYNLSLDLQNLIVVMNASLYGGFLPLNVTFHARIYSNHPPYQGHIIFGDGNQSYVSFNSTYYNFTHVFMFKGIYNVTFNVVDNKNENASSNVVVFAGYPLFANVTLLPSSVPLEVMAKVVVYSGKPPYTVFWSFGNGIFNSRITNSTTIISYQYAIPGNYVIYVKVKDSLGNVYFDNVSVNLAVQINLFNLTGMVHIPYLTPTYFALIYIVTSGLSIAAIEYKRKKIYR
ncbi:MAG: protease pro-enzyme activation domain-containing protein [Thermoplasmata archaeon]